MSNTSYTRLGEKTIIPQADLENLVSAANRTGDTRKGGDSLGKKAGMEVICALTSGGTYEKVMALGPLSSDAWRVVDGSANFLPVNLLVAGGSWTKSAGCTYLLGLLTADGVDDPTASQVVALKAGTYLVTGTAANEGTFPTDYHAPRLRISGATDGALSTTIYKASSANHATAAEDATTKQPISQTFTIAVDQNVTFKVDVVDQAGALEAGSAFILLNLLQSA